MNADLGCGESINDIFLNITPSFSIMIAYVIVRLSNNAVRLHKYEW
jgi:hypothetical protein